MIDYIEVIREPVRVELEWIGEGWSGDYDPSDPDDTPLMRFTVTRRGDDGEWEEVRDASSCTRISANIAEENARQFADLILETVYDKVRDNSSVKRLCENLSWIGNAT